jgi:RNA polymerase sigma factor FliA
MESAYVRLFPSSSFGKTALRTDSGGTFMTEVSKRDNSNGADDAERERLLVEQLPQVRYIARRIHDRLPRHVLLEDLVHAGVVG